MPAPAVGPNGGRSRRSRIGPHLDGKQWRNVNRKDSDSELLPFRERSTHIEQPHFDEQVSNMAKAAPQKSGSARIRFVMLEADIPEGELSHFTHAIQQALRPATGSATTPRIATTQRLPDLNGGEAQAEAPTIDTSVEELDRSELADEARPARKPQQYRKPKVMDVDLKSDPSFAAFADEKKPDSHLKRNLVVAAWFKNARGVDAITIDHVYTCYRWVKWPSEAVDFGGPLRTLKRLQKVTQTEDGFAINGLGLQEVNDLGKD
jgi:hypothetical protein